MISILIPTVGRSDRLGSIVGNIHRTTKLPHEIIFIYEETDTETKSVLNDNPWPGVANQHCANYAGAIQSGYHASTYGYIFLGADDIRFHEEWDTAAMATMLALDNIKVVGTNDLWNTFVLAGYHSTHSLVSRTYIQEVGGVVDQGPGSILNPSYTHDFVDTEFVATAKMRSVFAPCLSSVVEHLHHTAGKSPYDETYAKNAGTFEYNEDLYLSRQHLWLAISR